MRVGPLTTVLLVACGLAGCGGGSDRATRTAATAQPYPPKAAEPPAAPPTTKPPAGRVVRVGAKAEGVAVDPRSGRVAVAVQDPARLVILDGRSGRRVRVVRLPGTARHVELAKPGGPFLVPVETADELAQVPVGRGPVVRTHVGEHPHDAAWLNGRAYTVDEFGSTLSEVQDGKLVRQEPVDVQPGGVVATGGALAVTSVRAYTVELFRPPGLRGRGAQSAGLGPSHVTADAGGRLYVADTRGRQLIVYRTRPRMQWLARLPLGGAPLGLGVDDRRGRLWVSLAERNQVLEVRLGNHPSVVRRVPTVRQPDSATVDPATGRVFVASRTDGTLELIDP